ncbi:MAG: flagellum-specific ATP synthase FliI [Deltaproteobacteria bacterium RIFCSPHIGHO2_02_FULL_50_15]|nr:MAG: flagellum-specific ATP synthase FliI [Deltaproteobacteria bacterium RIFCSPHIGHO2_02_FULL_50_15]
MSRIVDLKKIQRHLHQVSSYKIKGRVNELIGLVVRATVPGVRVGDLCFIDTHEQTQPIKAEVVGFKDNDVLLMPLGNLEGIAPGSFVTPTGSCLSIPVGEALLGRIVDGLGDPLDVDKKGPLDCQEYYPVHRNPPDPLKRVRVTRPISVGIKVIDALNTVGEGQRIGIFSAAGVGKSTLIGMISRNSEADINVIGLVGERGREVRDFLEQDLGEEGLKRSVVVVATSDQPSLVRAKAAYVTTAIAEYFRDKGKKVFLMMDSVTRFARALREIGLAVGEPPARQGYTPSVFSTLPRLLERSGNSEKGSITAFYTILVAGDDMNEPVADETRSILDGHLVMSRELANRGHYPAIDVSDSLSRVMANIVDPDHLAASQKLKEVVAAYEKERDLILIGAYESGTDPRVDYAIEKIEEVNQFLRQGVNEPVHLQESTDQLKAIFGDV